MCGNRSHSTVSISIHFISILFSRNFSHFTLNHFRMRVLLLDYEYYPKQHNERTFVCLCVCVLCVLQTMERKKIRVVKFTIKILFFYCYYSHLTCTSFDLSNRSPTEMKRNENKCFVAGAATIMLCITCLWSLITC